MRRTFSGVLLGSAVFATAALAADDYMIMPKSTREFKSVAGGYVSQQALLNHRNSQASVTIRDKNGQAEVHADWEDHMFILAGDATLVLGGTVENPSAGKPGETKGVGIKGGKAIVLHPEDYIFIPVNTPHQMLVAPGNTIRYTVVKTHP